MVSHWYPLNLSLLFDLVVFAVFALMVLKTDFLAAGIGGFIKLVSFLAFRASNES